jgi:hypothetical protein
MASQGENMNYSDKRKPQNPLTTPVEAEDESIIDLVEEIDEPTPPNALSALERKLLNIGGELNAAGEPPLTLADLDDLDFEEEEDQAAGDLPALEPPIGEAETSPSKEDMDWLYGPGADAHSAEIEKSLAVPASENDRSLGFEEQSPEAEDVLEAATPLAKTSDPESEDDDIELLDIEDAEVDDEIVWFDDLDKEPLIAEGKLEAEADAAPLFDPDPNPLSESSAADIFSAHVESGLTAAETAIPTDPPLAAAVPAAAPMNSLVSRLPLEPSPPETLIPSGTAGLSAEEIDAAVERVLERKLGGTLQSIIRQAIEAAVSKEIQRLKALLLEDDPGERTP